MKKYFLFLIFISCVVSAQEGGVKGLFLSTGVGPRAPLGSFADKSNPGGGFDVSLSYTDDTLMPLFINVSVGYVHFPGSQDYYAASDHSSFSSNLITASFGVRCYLSPMMNDIFLLMPVIEGSLVYGRFGDFHQFKPETLKGDVNEKYSKIGFQAGAGISMFLFDLMAHYNYLPEHNYLSLDLRVRIPVFASM